jgi:hypothetical protein
VFCRGILRHLIWLLQEKLWRLRSKRKWIQEQLHALRGGFPKDSAYDEPWSDAFGM